MGWWSEDIMGGDTPLDIEFEFEDQFGPDKMYTDAITFIDTLIKEWDEDDVPVIQQVVGFQIMKHGYPMSDELRATVIRGIDTEDLTEWQDIDARQAALADFRKLVKAYTGEGAMVMPHQCDLLEKISEHLEIKDKSV